MAACAQLPSAPLSQLESAPAPQLDCAVSDQLLSASPLHPAELSPADAQLDKTAAAELDSSEGLQLETLSLEMAPSAPNRLLSIARQCSRGKELIESGPVSRSSRCFANATFDLLRAKPAAGHLLEKLTSQKGLQNQPLFQRDARRRARPKKLALHLESREGGNQSLAGLYRLLYPVHQLLKAEVERNSRVFELIGFREPVTRRFNGVGPRDDIPHTATVIADFDRVIRGPLLTGIYQLRVSKGTSISASTVNCGNSTSRFWPLQERRRTHFPLRGATSACQQEKVSDRERSGSKAR